MKAEKLAEKNAELQKQLNTENEEYYGDLLVYLRSHSILRDEKKIEEMLLVILQDILEAQQDNIAAEEYLGKDPKAIADEIIQEVPVNLWDFVKLVAFAIGVYGLASIIPALTVPEKGIDVGKLLIVGVYATVFAFLILRLVGSSSYQEYKKLAKITLWLGVSIGFIVGLLLSIFIRTSWIIYLPGFAGILVLLVVLALLIFWFSRQSDKGPWLPFIPVVSTASLVAIFTRIPMTSNLLATQTGGYIIAGILVVALILQYVLLFRWSRKQKRKQA